MAQWLRISMAMQETQKMQVQSLGQEDPMEKEMATHSSLLAWEMLWTEEPGGYCPWGHKESEMTEQLSTETFPALLILIIAPRMVIFMEVK